MEKQLNEWQKLAEEFYERLTKKGKTGKLSLEEYIRELFPFVREKNLDPFDASAITLIVTGSEPLSSLVKAVLLKKEYKTRKLREEVV